MISNDEVGLIGLGQMGKGIAKNLLEKGYKVFGYDINPDSLEWLRSAGGGVVAKPNQIPKTCKAIILFVVNDQQTEELLFGESNLLSNLNPESVIVTCSTMPPAYVKELGNRLAKKGFKLVDAPVTGGKVGAEAGTLTVMAAGKSDDVVNVSPILKSFSKNLFILGETPGMGSEMKVINQLMCGVHIVAAAEALAFAKRSGLDPKKALDVLKTGAATSWMLGDRGPRMANGTFNDVTSAIDIFIKDMGLVVNATESIQFDAPLAKLALKQFQKAGENGFGKEDDSAVFKNY